MTERTYESAVARVEEIIRRLDSGEAGLRETLDLVKEGRELVEYCAGELDAVSQGLEELKLDELVTRLESNSRLTRPARPSELAPPGRVEHRRCRSTSHRERGLGRFGRPPMGLRMGTKVPSREASTGRPATFARSDREKFPIHREDLLQRHVFPDSAGTQGFRPHSDWFLASGAQCPGPARVQS